MSVVEARLDHVEQQAEHLAEQVKLLKRLITTEMLDLRKVTEQQMAEVKQAMMYQDQLYQERVERLEARIQQLSEFCLLLARSTGHAAPTAAMVSSGTVTLSSPQPSTIEPGVSTIKMNGTGAHEDNNNNNNSDADDGDGNIEPMGVTRVLEKYKSRIDAIYDFYTTSNIDVFHPTLTMTQFSRLVKDCQLCGPSQGNSAELLWMAVMRSLSKKQGKRLAETHPQNQSITLGHATPSERKKRLFAYQRLETIPKHLFGEALCILAREKRRRKLQLDGIVTTDKNISSPPLDEKPEETVLAFLLYHIFPFVDAVMEERLSSENTRSLPVGSRSTTIGESPSLEKRISIEEYKSDAVRSITKEFWGRIKESYTMAVKTAQGHQSTVMNLDGFVEIARRYGLLPLIRKPELRWIFISCTATEKEKNPEADEGTISVGTFLLALYHLADHIYGSSLTVKMFPTPESRIKKLLAKMFLLA